MYMRHIGKELLRLTLKTNTYALSSPAPVLGMKVVKQGESVIFFLMIPLWIIINTLSKNQWKVTGYPVTQVPPEYSVESHWEFSEIPLGTSENLLDTS